MQIFSDKKKMASLERGLQTELVCGVARYGMPFPSIVRIQLIAPAVRIDVSRLENRSEVVAAMYLTAQLMSTLAWSASRPSPTL